MIHFLYTSFLGNKTSATYPIMVMKNSFTGIEWQDYLVIAAYFGSVLAVGLYVSHISYAMAQRHP